MFLGRILEHMHRQKHSAPIACKKIFFFRAYCLASLVSMLSLTLLQGGCRTEIRTRDFLPPERINYLATPHPDKAAQHLNLATMHPHPDLARPFGQSA